MFYNFTIIKNYYLINYPGVNISLKLDKDFVNGLKAGIPIALGYLSVSFAFGITASNGGLPAWINGLISLTNLTSAGQVAGVQLILEKAPIISIAITTFIINIRYMLMSLSLVQKMGKDMTLKRRLLISYGITDEIFAVASQQKGIITHKFMYGLILLPVIGWVSGTLIGSFAGNILPMDLVAALSVAIYGMFIAIIVPPCKQSFACMFVVIISIAISCLLYYIPIFKSISNWSIIICAVIAAGIGALLFPKKADEDMEDNPE